LSRGIVFPFDLCDCLLGAALALVIRKDTEEDEHPAADERREDELVEA